MLQPYLICRKHLKIYFSTTYPYGFPDHLFNLFFTISFTIFRHGSQYLASYYCRYQSLSHFSSHPNFGSYFLVFGMVFKKFEVSPHRLYCEPLNLILTHIAKRTSNLIVLVLKEMMKLWLSNLRIMFLDPFFQEKNKKPKV